MLSEQILSMVAAFLQTCKCKLSVESKLSDLGIDGDKLRNFKNLLQHHYSSPFNESEYNSWITINDIVRDVEKRVKSLL